MQKTANPSSKKLLSLLALAAGLTLTTTACSGKNPFEATSYIQSGVPVIQLQSIADRVVLEGYKVNRGNCQAKLGGIYPLPLDFKFGDGVKLFAYSCKVKEVELKTNHGTFTYSFSQ